MSPHSQDYKEDKDDGSDVALLRGSDDGEHFKHPSRKRYITVLYFTLAAVMGGLAASTIWASFWTLRSCPVVHSEAQFDPDTTTSQFQHCGSTPSQARSLGCKFQTWSYSWVPEPCFDLELAQEFIDIHEKGDLPYYADRNGTQVVDFDTVYKGEVEELYTVWGSHFWHCAFLMRKFYRQQALMTVPNLDYEHLKHCQTWLSDPFRYDWKKVNIKAPLVYAMCDASGGEILGHKGFEIIE